MVLELGSNCCLIQALTYVGAEGDSWNILAVSVLFEVMKVLIGILLYYSMVPLLLVCLTILILYYL